MRKLTILLAEDNYADQKLVRMAIEEGNEGTDLQVVADGDEALAYLFKKGNHSNAPRPDVLILDLNLPKKNGREVLSEIRKDPDLKHLPVVIMTSSRAMRDVADTAELNANLYLIKPSEVEVFLALIKGVEAFGRELARSSPGKEQTGLKLIQS
jgi:chemotaxis family two-component system response regulator Rcp1